MDIVTGLYTLATDVAITKTPAEDLKDFAGVLDGNGHTITLVGTNLNNANNTSLSWSGEKDSTVWLSALFAYNTGTIKNLTIEGEINYTSEPDIRNIGVFCARNYGTIQNCINKANINVTLLDDVGGICARVEESGKVINCVNLGNITFSATSDETKSFFAGIAGRVWGDDENGYGSVENCVNYGTMRAEDGSSSKGGNHDNMKPGGIAGCCSGILTRCYVKENCIEKKYTNPSSVIYIFNYSSVLNWVGNNDNTGTLSLNGSFTGSGENSVGAVSTSQAAYVSYADTVYYTENPALASGTYDLKTLLNEYVNEHSGNGYVEWDYVTIDENTYCLPVITSE